MRNETKKLMFAVLALLMTVAICVLVVGCEDTTDPLSTTVATLPFESTGPTQTTASTQDTVTTGNTTKPIETTNPVVPPITTYINPLTGLPAVRDLSQTRPIAIVVDNCYNSYSKYQTGLDDADILYEALVAPGITRFLMVVADYQALDSVCNIRSGRDYHMDMAAFHNAVLVCHGGSQTDNYDFFSLAKARYGDRYGFIDTKDEPWFSWASYGEDYGTIAHYGVRKDLNYDTIFKPSALTALLKSKKNSHFIKAGGSLDGAAKQSIRFASGARLMPVSAEAATKVDISFTSKNTVGEWDVSFRYDAAKDKYLRSQNGKPHMDTETGDQLAFTNVITLFTDVTNAATGISSDKDMSLVKTRGSGTGYYFYGGKVMEIRWTSTENSLALADTNGAELTLARGNTYIGYLDKEYIYGGDEFWS